MPGRPRTGSIRRVARDSYVIRVTYTDTAGRRRDISRRYSKRSDAEAGLAAIKHEIELRGCAPLVDTRRTFSHLAEMYEIQFLIPPTYRDGRRVSGLRSIRDLKGRLATLRAHFGAKLLRSITYGDLVHFRTVRLAAPTRSGGERSLASVNRDLALLRRMLNIAASEQWIERNPFRNGPALISLASESVRNRVLAPDEERRLLAACTGRRAHLAPILIAAIDLGARRGELFGLRWADIDLEDGVVTIVARNSKTNKPRTIPMSARLGRELERIRELAAEGERLADEALVFGLVDNVQTSFESARKAARIEGLRFHDLRHTCGSRLAGQGIPLAEIAQMLGHTSMETTYRHYLNSSTESRDRARRAIDDYNSHAVVAFDSDRVN